MKTYGKNVDVLDIGFIRSCVMECLSDKWRRRDVRAMIAKYGKLKKSSVRKLIKAGRKEELFWVIDIIAKDIRNHISSQDICLPAIRFSKRYDKNSRKYRKIGTQSIIHQCYEYVAVNACKELFYKKYGTYQCASIPGRGQSYGKKAICKWMSQDVPGTRYALKMDVQKCYPSVDQTKIKELLYRDLHKNKDLLYLLYSLIDMYTEGGLSIGSHLSQWLCNYYLSYAYHYISEQLYTTRKSKRTNEEKRVRLISHVLFYMDDILVFGSNKKYLMMAMQMIVAYFGDVLKLTIKPDWRLFKVHYIDKYGKSHGSFVDMMGFRFYRNKVTVRQNIFKKLKRKALRFVKVYNKFKKVPNMMAKSIMSYWGWIKNTNSFKIIRKYRLEMIINIARKTISRNARMLNAKQKQCAAQ